LHDLGPLFQRYTIPKIYYYTNPKPNPNLNPNVSTVAHKPSAQWTFGIVGLRNSEPVQTCTAGTVNWLFG